MQGSLRPQHGRNCNIHFFVEEYDNYHIFYRMQIVSGLSYRILYFKNTYINIIQAKVNREYQQIIIYFLSNLVV